MSIMLAMQKPTSRQSGAISASTIVIIILAVLLATAGSLAIWSYMQYVDQKTDVDGRVALAVSEAEKKQAEKDEAKFAEREKEPNRDFVGPVDYGRVTFKYPKTWSVYEETDVSQGEGDYKAYFNPVTVPPVDQDNRFALRVTIQDESYDAVLEEYAGQIEEGELKSSGFEANGANGTLLEGKFSDDIRGAAVVFKVRDKTLTVHTDANTFRPDFNKIVKTIEFNK